MLLLLLLLIMGFHIADADADVDAGAVSSCYPYLFPTCYEKILLEIAKLFTYFVCLCNCYLCGQHAIAGDDISL